MTPPTPTQDARCPTCGMPIAPTLLGAMRAARTSAGLSEREMGRRLVPPVSHPAISYIETGKTRVTIDLLIQWARICGIDPAMLFKQAVKTYAALEDAL